MDIFNVLTMIGGLCLFLFGMNLMGQALERRAGGKLRSLLDKMTGSVFAGFLTGLGITAIIQSSSATTVMVVGFVNSGLMTLRQAINVIMGANVGTTVTAWLLSLGGIDSGNFWIKLLKPSSFTPVLALIGIIYYMFCKDNKKKDTGMILLGFATLMFGMETMSGAVAGLKDVPAFTNLFVAFQNPLLGVLAGALLTAIIQSSSASVGILQALAVTGSVSYAAAIPIIMGQNIGTTVTAMISSIGTNKNARRAARVEVALISVDIPDKEPVSKIRLELNNEMTDHMKADPQLAALVSSDPIAAAVERYNAAAEGIRRIYEEYNGIKSLFSAATADDKETEVLNFNKSYNEAIRSLRGLYWQKLFDLPQIRDNLTRAMQDEYHNRVSELVDYDFSPYNILTIREEMSANIVQGIESEIVELFDDWTNLHYNSEYSKNVHYYNGWCTNEAYKVIFRCSAWGDYSGRFEPSWNAESCLSRIERTLHHLDTNGKKYNGDELRATLKAAEESRQSQNVQFRYFTATFYKKGTCHITFTNDDVLKSFNLFASQKKGWLPPSYGKKSYNDMSCADRAVVDSFEGKDSYNDTMVRHLVPTTATLMQLAAHNPA